MIVQVTQPSNRSKQLKQATARICIKQQQYKQTTSNTIKKYKQHKQATEASNTSKQHKHVKQASMNPTIAIHINDRDFYRKKAKQQ